MLFQSETYQLLFQKNLKEEMYDLALLNSFPSLEQELEQIERERKERDSAIIRKHYEKQNQIYSFIYGEKQIVPSKRENEERSVQMIGQYVKQTFAAVEKSVCDIVSKTAEEQKTMIKGQIAELRKEIQKIKRDQHFESQTEASQARSRVGKNEPVIEETIGRSSRQAQKKQEGSVKIVVELLKMFTDKSPEAALNHPLIQMLASSSKRQQKAETRPSSKRERPSKVQPLPKRESVSRSRGHQKQERPSVPRSKKGSVPKIENSQGSQKRKKDRESKVNINLEQSQAENKPRRKPESRAKIEMEKNNKDKDRKSRPSVQASKDDKPRTSKPKKSQDKKNSESRIGKPRTSVSKKDEAPRRKPSKVGLASSIVQKLEKKGSRAKIESKAQQNPRKRDSTKKTEDKPVGKKESTRKIDDKPAGKRESSRKLEEKLGKK